MIMNATHSKLMMAVSLMAILSSSVFVMASMDESSADSGYDKDLGQFYSYTVQFIFSGSQAATIEWDFGDGSEKSSEWNPQHVFSEKGTYIVTQTVTNTYNGTSTASERFKVEIMGFPVITFDSNGGSSVASIQQTAYNVIASKPADSTKSGSTFNGWKVGQDSTDHWDWTTPVTRSMTLFADWTSIKHTISFDANGGSLTVASQDLDEGSTFSVPGYSGTKDGHSFGGWRLNGTTYVQGQSFTVTGDATLTAVWNEIVPGTTHTVTFSVGDVDIAAPDAQDIQDGSKASAPASVLEGYTIVWYLGDEIYDFDTPVTSDIVLTAHAEKIDDPNDDGEGIPIWVIALIIIIAIIAVIAVMMVL